MKESASRQSGEWTQFGVWGELEHGATVSCVHCQATWVSEPGSGRLRGFCQKCMGYICGPACVECVPWERQCENYEAGRDPLTPTPPMIQVPRNISGG